MKRVRLPARAPTLQSAQTELREVAADVDNVKLHDLGETTQYAQDVVQKMETTLSEAEIESALETMNDPSLDTGRLELSIRELRRLDEAP